MSTIPRTIAFQPLPKESAVALWYSTSHPPMVPHLQDIHRLIQESPGIHFYVIGKQDPDRWLSRLGGFQNVTLLGRTNLGDLAAQVRGLVRISDPLDLGRSVFEFVARGRFYASNSSCLRWGPCFSSPNSSARQLEEFIESFDDEKAASLSRESESLLLPGRSEAFQEWLESAFPELRFRKTPK